jgi:hypothetical protein
MSFAKRRDYLYRGSAFGVAARFEHPWKTTIPTQAAAVIAPTGGESFDRVRNFDYHHQITFDEAIAHVVGSQDPDQTFNTVATAIVRNINFLGMVHAEMVVANVTSIHKPSAGDGDTIPESHVKLTGSFIRGLIVAGQELKLQIDTEPFAEHSTFPPFRGAKHGRCYTHGDLKEATVVTSIVKSIEGCKAIGKNERDQIDKPDYQLPGVRCFENIIFVPHFGKIHLGEVIVERGYRRLNMLRIELGCGTGGGGSVGGGEGNGGSIPP